MLQSLVSVRIIQNGRPKPATVNLNGIERLHTVMNENSGLGCQAPGRITGPIPARPTRYCRLIPQRTKGAARTGQRRCPSVP
jgi:hypothetical protein